MANLAELMRGRIEDLVKAPKAPPLGDYPGVIRKFEPVEFQGKDGKDYAKLRLSVGLLGWAEGVPESERLGIEDITRRVVSCDYWLPVGRDFALLCQQCGLSGEISEQTPYELIGKPVLVVLQHEVSRRNKDEIFVTASKLIGTA